MHDLESKTIAELEALLAQAKTEIWAADYFDSYREGRQHQALWQGHKVKIEEELKKRGV